MNGSRRVSKQQLKWLTAQGVSQHDNLGKEVDKLRNC